MEPRTVGQLAAMVGGRVEGSSDVVCRGAAPLHEATADDITLAEDARALASGDRPRPAAVLAPAPLPEVDLPQIVVDDLHAAFSAIICHFRPRRAPAVRGVSSAAHVHPTARIGPGTVVHPGAMIGAEVAVGAGCVIHSGVTVMEGSRLGDDVVLFPNVVLYPDTVLEARVTVHAGSVLGADGFGYRTHEGQHQRAAQLGYVYVEADVDIGACVTIDRGTYGATRIGRGTKIDNQVMIAHNCQIGRHNLICSQVGIAGSSHTGNYVVLAGQVGLADHVELADQVVVGAQAGVMHDLSEAGTYLGSPAMPHREQMQIFASLRRLPQLCRSVKRLERSQDPPPRSEKHAA